MAASDVTVGVIFLAQIFVGSLGYYSLLLHFLVLDFTGGRVRHTDLILKHLTVANLLTLLCRGVPQTVAALGMKVFLSDLECKLLFYVHRVGRGVSIGSTCLLSSFQAITISPGDSRWAALKEKALRYMCSSTRLNWILYGLLNVMFPVVMTGNWSHRNITCLKDFGYCSAARHDTTTDSLFAALLSFPDAVCVGLMLWSSSSMVYILHRHKQRMQHVHKVRSPKSSPESRATKTILLLVSTFVSFYTLSCIFQIFVTVNHNPNWLMVNVGAIVSGCFPTISPFLLMRWDSRASRLCLTWIRNRKIPDMRNM
ncbi:Vomeronasal type-1 receptor 4 [Sciurus carolinensis]|uniref:Vomeronasal type-1 receptor n=1 Tax=Sciurus carolinensis TaxID=30640 RepID=A0AA41MIW0_SCICA|nr:Vomeronasal type-1 receptor 4 [Sciurus carolinensis]